MNEVLHTTATCEVFSSFILKDNKKRKHMMFFKILKAVESFVSLVRGWGSWPLPFQQGQEVTWGNVFALRMRAWIAANNLHLFAYWTRTHKRDYNKNLFWTAAYSLPLELCGAGTGRCQPFTHSLWPTSLPRFAVWVLMLLKKKKKKLFYMVPALPIHPGFIWDLRY